MAQMVYRFDCLIPAGTLKTAPAKVPMKFGNALIDEIDILVPPGPRGNIGFQIAQGDAQVVPTNTGEWIVSDDDKIRWMMSGQPQSGNFQLLGYNNGQYDHTVYVTFLCHPIDVAGTGAATGPLNVVGQQIT